MLLHIKQRKLIGRNYVEDVILQGHGSSYVKVIGSVVLRSRGAKHILSWQRNTRLFEELAAQKARVATRRLVDLDRVVGKEVADDKVALSIVPNGRDELGPEA